MRQEADGEQADRQVSRRFRRQLSLAALCGLVLVLATCLATGWMARQQDAAARASSQRMVSGGIEGLIERNRKMLLDYAIWTDAYQQIRAGDLDWMYANIGASAEIGTFDLAVVLPPGGGDLGWRNGGGEAPVAGLLEPEALATAIRPLAEAAPGAEAVSIGYARSGGALWLLAAARVVPQDGLPEGTADADLPRLVLGTRVDARTFDSIQRRFGVADLAVTGTPPPGRDAIALAGADGRPLAYVSWTAPTPGWAVLKAALLPLALLMLAAAFFGVAVSRELVRSARRLEAALAQVRAADRMKTQFLANVSHELRTPLTGVIGTAQLLELRAQDPESRQLVEILLASAHAQLELVNRLLDTSRIESGEMRIDRLPFDPAAVLEETTRLIAPEAATKGLALEVSIAPEARRRFVGDALAFRQVVSNLVGNALKFTDLGRIEVALALGDDGLSLRVADTGAGIHPADHQRIFERFVQVDGSATRRVGGAGLGLGIVRALVELMGGRIAVSSVPGLGATFVVTLPLPTAPADPMAAAA